MVEMGFKYRGVGRGFGGTLEIGNGNLRLPAPKPWTLDVKTGVSQILDSP